MKIYEKDGAMWAEHDGWMVCAINPDETVGNPLGNGPVEKAFHVVLRCPEGSITAVGISERGLVNEYFPTIGENHAVYHQTLRELMGKPYAPAETNDDLYISGKYLPDGDCYFDGPVSIKRPIDTRSTGNVQYGDAMKRPIDPSEVDETWVGATVECLRGIEGIITSGKTYTAAEGTQRGRFVIQNDRGLLHSFYGDAVKHFTLVKKADGPFSGDISKVSVQNKQLSSSEVVEKHREHNIPKTRTEVTHSAELEFPNGDRVAIPPPPESEGWEAVEWIWGHGAQHYNGKEAFYVLHRDSINHYDGEMMFLEYANRAFSENPQIISLTKWTRTVSENTMGRINQYREQLEYHKTEVAKRIVDSTWPQRHPSGAVKRREE